MLRLSRPSSRPDSATRGRPGVGAWALTRLIAALLYNVTPTDPATLAIVAAALGVVSLTAGYIPARRATRIDPTVALRSE
jgi:ABC-type antimicrobial peptide transport system permease subunit